MVQIARPNADVSDGLWTPTPIYPQINGIIPGPGVVTSSNNPSIDAFEVELSPLILPGPGAQTLTVGLDTPGVGCVNVGIALFQGSTVIASWTVNTNPSSSFAYYALTLTPSQVATITDYTQLRVKVTANAVCYFTTPPTTLYATFANISNCACCNGASITLTWNGGSWSGSGTFGTCGAPMGVDLACSGSTWGLTLSQSAACNGGASSPASIQCIPLSIVFDATLTSSFGSKCCGGVASASVQVTITT